MRCGRGPTGYGRLLDGPDEWAGPDARPDSERGGRADTDARAGAEPAPSEAQRRLPPPPPERASAPCYDGAREEPLAPASDGACGLALVVLRSDRPLRGAAERRLRVPRWRQRHGRVVRPCFDSAARVAGWPAEHRILKNECKLAVQTVTEGDNVRRSCCRVLTKVSSAPQWAAMHFENEHYQKVL